VGEGRDVKIFDVLARFSRTRASAVRARVGGARTAQQLSVPLAAQPQGRPAGDAGDPAGAEPSPADPIFPKLEVAKDPELMREVFQRHLQPLDGKTYQILECQLSYIHHRKALRYVAHYDLRFAEPELGCDRSTLVTGVMYAGGRTRRTWEKLQRTEPEQNIPDTLGTFEPVSYIPDLDMLVQVFPYDHRLPALPLLMTGPPPELEPLLLAQFGLGDWRAEAWDVEPIRYRAVQRAALRLTAQARDAVAGRAEKRRFYAKIYLKEEEGEQAYQVLRALWEKACTGDVGFTVPRPIAYLGSLRTLLQEEVPGKSLQLKLHKRQEAIPAVRRVAEALAALHLTEVVAPRTRPLRDEVAVLERAGKALLSACPHLGSKIEEIVGAVVDGLEEGPLAPIHGDLKPAHIMVNGDSVALIDLDKVVMADPVLDIAQFLFPLARIAPRSRLSQEERLRRALAQVFVEEYFVHVPQAWRVRLPLHYAGAALKKAAASSRNRSPGWSEKIEVLLMEAESSLAGRVW
jgi:tRNA A-37 threonylcarbamoyl transferase component Bud32